MELKMEMGHKHYGRQNVIKNFTYMLHIHGKNYYFSYLQRQHNTVIT